MLSSYYFRSFDPKDQDNAIYTGVKALMLMVQSQQAEELAQAAQAAVIHTCNIMLSMSDYSLSREWIPAAKRHKDRVAKICTQIFQISKSTGVSNPVRSVQPSKITFYDGFALKEEEISPRSFWKCYKLFGFIENVRTAEELVAVLQVICCIFTIYKLVGVQGRLLDELASKHLEEQRSTALKDSSTTHLLDEVEDFLQHIDRCVLQGEQPRTKAASSYLAAVKLAKKDFKRPEQSRDELPLSVHSSGMSITGKGTLPSMIASAFEGTLIQYDTAQADQIMHYTPSEKLCDLSGAVARAERTVFIPHRSKDDVRVIHTACNGIQDRMNYHARVVRSLTKRRRTIHVWDQMRGVRDIIYQFTVRRIRAGYSLDLHAATDSLDRNQQAIVYQHILRWLGYEEDEIEILSSEWLEFSSMELLVMLPYSGKYLNHRLATGQPMGFESSVDFLNASHDLWVTALSDYCEREYQLESTGHDILGDDFFIGFKRDKDMVFPYLYKDLMQELNTECNLEKGYIYNADKEEYKVPLAEFAKNLVCDGINITPLPLGALTLCNTKQGLLSFLTWYKERMDIERIDANFIASYFKDDDNGDIVQLLCSLPVDNQFRALVWGKEGLPTFRIKDYKVLICVSIAFIRQFYMLSILNELNSDKDYIPRVTDYNSFTEEWRSYAKMILKGRDQLPNNKFVALIERLELTALAQSCSMLDIAQGILPFESKEDAILDILPALKGLTDADLSVLIELFDIINNIDKLDSYKDIWKPVLSDELTMSLTDSLNRLKLADFNPTAQRYGVQKEKITAGFDFDSLRSEATRLFELFDITDQDRNDTLSYLADITGTRVKYTWNTRYLEPEFDPEEDQFDIWTALGFSF